MSKLTEKRAVTIADILLSLVITILVDKFAYWISKDKRLLIGRFYWMIIMLQILFFAYNAKVSQVTIRLIVVLILFVFLYVCFYLNITNLKEALFLIGNILFIPHPYSITGYLLSSFFDSFKDS